MGRRGPRPKPSALEELEGNPGKRQHRRRDEPKPGAGEHPVPAHLGRYGRDEWRRLAPILERLGLLTETDDAALTGYCEAHENWRQARLVLARLRRPRRKGEEPVRSIDLARAEQSVRQWLGLRLRHLVEFGLTPSAKSRVEVEPAMPKAPPKPEGKPTGTEGKVIDASRFFRD